MKLDNRAILDNILTALREDPILAAYVKHISHGDMREARDTFPFIEVGNFHITADAPRYSGMYLNYAIEIICGTKSLIPGAAYTGNPATGAKGIGTLCHDIKNALNGSTLRGSFQPVYRFSCRPGRKRDDNNFVHTGSVIFHARHWVSFL